MAGCIPTYDANGNLTADCSFVPSYTYTWDAYGNPATQHGIALTYDALNREVEAVSGSTHVQTLYSPTGKLGLMNGQTAKTIRIPLPGGSTAELLGATGGTVHILHSDWLGSSGLSTTYGNRTVSTDVAYAPYGENYPSSTADLNFTGQSQDTFAGQYNFLYRKYNPVQGRWISPDPSGLNAVDPGNPQSWNRYAYVLNNPLMYTDLRGLGPCDSNGNEIESNFEDSIASGGTGVICPNLWQLVGCTIFGKCSSVPCFFNCGGTTSAPNNGPQKACPAVPAHPANANVNSNIALTNVVYYANWLNPPTQAAFTDGWLVSMVAPNAPWDYKTQGQQYDAFGNFNFGATGAAAGIPLQVLQAGAGAVSALVGTNSSAFGSWYQPPLYGHAPIKSQTIAAGYAYYQQGCK